MEPNPKRNQTKVRNIIVTLSLLVLFTPFIFITNLFPFMRFGMFAEKVTTISGIEVFEVRLKGKEIKVTKQEIPISHFMLNYLIRNYYYKGQINTCAINLYQLSKQTICIYKKNISEKHTSEELILCYPNE